MQTDRKVLLAAYRRMLLIRCFEEAVEKLFRKGLVKGTAHPAIGQEATAVGAALALRKGDYVTSTHRGHGHFIALGADPRRMMAELFGKETGYSRGRGGSQLMADYRLGFLGSNGITGGGIPFATGVGLSIKSRSTRQVALCFFGDGAACQGAFHESLNMAALWRLPVIYLCENNQYAMSTPVRDTIAGGLIAARADGYGIPGVPVDGNDVVAVRDAVAQACRRARAGQGPTLLECITYRLSGHSRGDMCNYRPAHELKEWSKRDPITRMTNCLKKAGALSPDGDRRIRADVRREIRETITFARRSPDPDPATLTEGVLA